MAEYDLVGALNDCIDRLASGQSMDDCLRSYPQFADQLRPMLEAGGLARRSRYSPAEVNASKSRARLRVEQAALNFRPYHVSPLRRAATVAARAAAVLILVTGVTSVLAERSLPGDPLYGVKRFTESVRLAASNNALQEMFAQRRIDEIRQLQAAKRVAQVTFHGLLESVEKTSVQVTGLKTQINARTAGLGSVRVGDWVEVDAYTTLEGALVATVIHPVGAGEPELLVTPKPTPLTPAASPTGTSTLTPSATPTASPSATPSATSTPTATVCTPLRPDGWITYTVRAGDTLSVLASSVGATIEQLMAPNCLPDDDLIYAGQQLFLPLVPVRLAPVTTLPGIEISDTPGSDNGAIPGDDNIDDSGNTGDDKPGDDHSGSD